MKALKIAFIALATIFTFSAAEAQVHVGVRIGTPPPPPHRVVVVHRAPVYHRRVVVVRHRPVYHRRVVVVRHR